jgi:hypothetical protein
MQNARVVRPDAHDVAVAQAPACLDPLAVDERAVPRQPLVGEDPLVAEAFELGVQPRDLRVPRQRDVVAGRAADRHAPRGAVEHLDALVALAVAEHEERVAVPLHAHPLLQLGGR